MIEVSVVLATPERQQIVELRLVEGSSAWDAVRCAIEQGLDVRVLIEQQRAAAEENRVAEESGRGGSDSAATSLDETATVIGIYGQVVDHDCLVQSGDRIELYRPLILDPMEQRRRRARQGD